MLYIWGVRIIRAWFNKRRAPSHLWSAMQSFYFSNEIEKRFFMRIYNIFLMMPLAVVLFLMPDVADAKLKIDGRLDEPDWATARVFQDFIVIDPLTFDTPRLLTEARLLSTPEGLAVAFICHQPSDEIRTRTVTRRDANEFDADSVSFMVDFDGTGVTAYEFSVSVTGSYRDGTITHENRFNYDWDGLWQRAVDESSDHWTVEILLPWSIVAMREDEGETRNIAVFFQREVNASGEKFAFPATSPIQPRFVSDFEKVAVPRYSAREFDVWPYATVMSDFVRDSITAKTGLDIFWKKSGDFQAAATFYPDFGQVESDDLVINFTAIETAFSDKRPFFTENQGIFNSMLPGNLSVFYTRRIGGESDKDRTPSDILGAVKAIGSAGSLNYGLFSALEDGDAGKQFYAGRMVYPGETLSLGVLSTYVERPFVDRTALVNTIDYDVRLGESWRWYGHFIGSTVSEDTGSTHGYGIFSKVEYTPNDRWGWLADLTAFSDDLDFNDMGYMERNSLEKLFVEAQYNQTEFGEDSRTASVAWEAKGIFERNTDGVRLRNNFQLEREQKMRSGSEVSVEIWYNTEGYDDLISRGNGLVHLNDQWDIELSYETPKRGAWRQSISLGVFQEGYEDWGAGFGADVTWYPYDTFNLEVSVNPRWSRDWLIWLQEDRFGSFSHRDIAGNITANWFPAESHEFRMRAQWLTIDADAEQGYCIGPRGRLVESNDVVDDFAMINFGVQFRYRYEIAPLSDFYVVYSRGGLERIEDPSRNTLGLLGDSTSLRDSDQFLIKLRYRF